MSKAVKLLFFSCLIIGLFFCLDQPAYSSLYRISASSRENSSFNPQNMLDNNLKSRWSSEFSDEQWIQIDFGCPKIISGLLLYWQEAYAVSYDVALSEDGENWKTVYSQTAGKGGSQEITFDEQKTRFLKIILKQRATQWGYSLFEIYPLGGNFEDDDEINTGEIISLEGKWFFKKDPDNLGLKKKWFLDSFSTDNWEAIELGRYWEEQGQGDYDGYAWYKKDIFIPKNWRDDNPGIMFAGVDDAYELYINGKRVISFGSMNSEENSVCNTATAFSVGKYLHAGEYNDFTIRVFDFWGAGGINKSPMIIFQKAEALEKLKSRVDALSYYQKKARPSKKKYYPQWTGARQAYWTVVGTKNSKIEATFGEDGMLQLYNQGPSLMPYPYINNKLLTLFDFSIEQSLKEGYLPIPKVTWENEEIIFSEELFASNWNEASFACLRCTLINKDKKDLEGKIYFTLRPFQVNPAWQWAGGMAKVKKIQYSPENNIISINDVERILALEEPSGFDAVDYIEGDIIEKVKEGAIGKRDLIEDAFGYASGAIEYKFTIAANDKKEYLFIISLEDEDAAISQFIKRDSLYRKLFKKRSLYKDFDRMEQNTVSYWQEKLNQVKAKIPNEEILKTIKSSIAYILINRDGPMLQAGSGAYEKSWIRDSCISSAALLRMGYTQEVRDYIDWISKNVKDNGKVPPIMISEDKADPAWESVYEEYDSQGQYIFTVLQYYYFTKDKEWLRGKLPIVARVVDYMKGLRRSTMVGSDTPGYKREFYGLFPLSVSHEGYFPPPGVHSYWDDFWGLRGLKDAQEMAKILGDEKLAGDIGKEIVDFRKSVQDSISLVQELNNINYIPGCAERGDFDAPSAAIAVWPTEEAAYLPAEDVYNTFGIFWSDQFAPTLKTAGNWSYSSYALRIAQVFVFFNQRDKAVKMLEQYLQLKRPQAWNQWAEGTLADDRKPWFVGDLPHSWVAAIYINAFRSLFVYERGGLLVLAGGIPQKWIREQEVSIEKFPTYYGDISYSIIQKEDGIHLKITGEASPPEGFLLKLRINYQEFSSVKINDELYRGTFDEGIAFKGLPAKIDIMR
jgi:hypothetical protein